MAGLIPQDFIDDLLDRIDIVGLVDSRVKLKKTGKNYSACCPFHDEKTPSFTVSQDKQFYYCFGCGASGNALGFLMDYERLDFPDAVESLAHLAGLEVPREERSQAQVQQAQARKSLYTLLEKAAEFYTEQLKSHKGRARAVNYLKGRGLSGQIAKDFGIGYAPPGWDNLLKALGETEEDRRLLIEAGLLIHQADPGGERDKLYDRFRERIQFPIRDIRGRVIGFGGRVLDDSAAQGSASAAEGRKPKAAGPKYLNSPETPVFHKGKELYGLYEARQAYKEIPRLLVVEGYMDVVSLAQFGIRYGVATLGTASGEDHLQLAFKYTSEVVFCFDGDEAGRRAARRALEVALPTMSDGRTVRFLFLPDGEDPDTLVRQIGPDKFEALIRERAIPLEDYLFDAVSGDLELKRLEHRARLSKRAAPLIYRLPVGVFRELMFQQLAARTGLDRATLQELAEKPLDLEPVETPAVKPEVLPQADPGYEALWVPERDLDHVPPDYAAPRQPQLFAASQKTLAYTPAKLAAALLLYHNELVQRADQALDALTELQDPDLPLLRELVTYLGARPSASIGQVLGHWRGVYGQEAESRLGQIAGMHLFSAVVGQPQAELRERELEDIFAVLQQRLHRQIHLPLLDKARQQGLRGLSDEERAQLRELLAKSSS